MTTASDNCRSAFARFVVPIVRADEHQSEPPVATLPLPFISPKFDKVSGRRVYEPGKAPLDLIENETGLDRLKAMFSTDIYGVPGPEWTLIVHGTYGGIVAGAILGGLLGANRAKESYLERNQATKYHTELHAKRALQDRITLGLFSGALKYGIKMGGFSFLYIFSTTLFSVYRGKTSILDFIAAGTVSGFLWRFMMGPRAALVSGLLGGVLGIFTGGFSSLAFYLSGTSMEELRYWHYHSISKSIKGQSTGAEEPATDGSEIEIDKPTKSDLNTSLSATTSSSTTGTTSNIKT